MNKKGDRSQGLFAPPKRFRDFLDPMRSFSESTLAEIYAIQGYACSNPFCEFKQLPLQAHHIFAHSLGGKSILSNALILCESCHNLIHRGAVPLDVILKWKNFSNENFDYFYPPDPDELWCKVRSIPLSTILSGHERLFHLNKLLIQTNYLKSTNARDFILAEIMLAKVAVLSDSYRVVRGGMEFSKQAMDTRYRRILPFGSSAKYFGDKVKSSAITVRALHYRSNAFSTLGNLKKSLRTLKQAWEICQIVSPEGKPNEFHELSTPSRILRNIALIRARLKGSSYQSENEYNLGLSLAEKYGDVNDFEEANLRYIQLKMSLGKICEAERELDKISDNLSAMDTNTKLIGIRMRIEILIKKNGNVNEIRDIVDNAIEEAILHRLYRQELHFYTIKQMIK